MPVPARPPFLTDAEILELCRPLVQPSAQVRYLEGLGLFVKRRPDGTPLLAVSEFERVLGAGRLAGTEGPPDNGIKWSS